MTTKGRKQHCEPQLDELTDETEDERRDFTDQTRNLFESDYGPVMGTDGDDNPEYVQPKAKFDGDKLERGDVGDPVRTNPRSNPAGEMVDAGHGFIVNDPRSRPWKTARRTHCAHCGGRLPTPNVAKYVCEFDPELPGCQCSGCTLRHLVASGYERNKGQPRMCCSAECTRQRDNERNRWKRSVARAAKHGQPAPAEPVDRGVAAAPQRAHRIVATQERLPARHDLRESKSAVAPWTVPCWAADPWLKFVRAGAVPIGRGQTVSYDDPVGNTASMNADRGPASELIDDHDAAVPVAA